MQIRRLLPLLLIPAFLAADWTVNEGPSRWFKMDDNDPSTDVVNSGSASSAIATLNVNTDTVDVTGKVAGALDFDGDTTRINGNSDFIGTGADSICIWHYPQGNGDSTNHKFVENGKVNFYWSHDTGTLTFSRDSVTGATASLPYVTSQWYYICVTSTAATPSICNIYVNGALSGSANQACGTPTAGTANVYIGSNSGAATASLDGYVDNFRHYTRVLSASEVAALYDIERTGHNFKSGKFFLKDGVPRLLLGAYHVDATAENGNAAELNRAADITAMGVMGLDAVFTPLTDTNTATMNAANSAGMIVVPEWNDTYTLVDAAHGPFEMVQVWDDLDAGCPASCTHTPDELLTEVNAKKAALSGTPLAYSSAGNIAADTSTYFGHGLDTLAYQAYPVGDENYTNHDYDLQRTNYWHEYMAGYEGPFIANAQSFKWSSWANKPTANEVYRMAMWAQSFPAAGIVWYTYYDSTTDYGDAAWSSQKTAWTDAITEIRRCQSYWLRRLMTE